MVALKQAIIVETVSKTFIFLLTLGIYLFFPPFQYDIIWTEADRKRPYLKETIPVHVAAVTLIGVGMLMLCVMVGTNTTLSQRSTGKSFSRVFWTYSAAAIVSLFSSLIVCWAVVEPIKRFIAEPRPHFLALCYGGVSHIPPLDMIPTKLTNEACINADSIDMLNKAGHISIAGPSRKAMIKTLNESRLSFPSAHSAFTANIFTWTGLYSQVSAKRLKLDGYNAIGTAILVAFVAPTIFIASSRIRDFWHYTWDVMFGLMIGMATALWQFKSYEGGEGFINVDDKARSLPSLLEQSALPLSGQYGTNNLKTTENQGPFETQLV